MRYHRPAPAPVAAAGASGGLGGEHPTATLKIQNPRYGVSGFHFVSPNIFPPTVFESYCGVLLCYYVTAVEGHPVRV
jgi:hypothetical protein